MLDAVDDGPAAPHALAAPGAPPTRSFPRRRWPWLLTIMTAGIGLAAALSAGFERDPSFAAPALIDEPAPPLAGPTLEGGQFDLADHHGQIVVVNVWASWCTVCRDEHPELEAAAAHLQPDEVQFVGLNTRDTVADAETFVKELGGASYPSVLDADGRKAADWKVIGVPQTFVLDARGRIRAKTVGKVTRQWLLSVVQQLRAEQAAP